MPSTTASISWPTFEHVGRTGDALDPGEFGNVDEAFDAALDFDERAVGKELGDLALDVLAGREIALDVCPTDCLDICLRPSETRSFSWSTSRMTTSTDWPMWSSSDGWLMRPHDMSVMWSRPSMPCEIDEGAEVGDVLDRAGDLVADLDGLEEVLAVLGALGSMTSRRERRCSSARR